MSDCQAIADRARDRGLRGEFTDAAMMRDGTHGVGGHRRRRSCRCPPFPPISAAGGSYQRTGDAWKFTEGSSRSGSSTPARWRARRPVQPGRPLTRHPRTRLWRKDDGDHGLVINGECARRST